jgi:hypothetical protein
MNDVSSGRSGRNSKTEVGERGTPAENSSGNLRTDLAERGTGAQERIGEALGLSENILVTRPSGALGTEDGAASRPLSRIDQSETT